MSVFTQCEWGPLSCRWRRSNIGCKNLVSRWPDQSTQKKKHTTYQRNARAGTDSVTNSNYTYPLVPGEGSAFKSETTALELGRLATAARARARSSSAECSGRETGFADDEVVFVELAVELAVKGAAFACLGVIVAMVLTPTGVVILVAAGGTAVLFSTTCVDSEAHLTVGRCSTEIRSDCVVTGSACFSTRVPSVWVTRLTRKAMRF